MKNQKQQPVTATGKLTKEQQAILYTVEREKYTAEELEQLFSCINKLNLPHFVLSIDVLIMDHLSSAETISDEGLAGLCNLFGLNRTLSAISGVPPMQWPL